VPDFGASFSQKPHPSKGEMPWEPPPLLSAYGTTFTPA